MLKNKITMRRTLIELKSKLQRVEPRLKGVRGIYQKVRYLELQEHCETLLEDVSREFGSDETHVKDVGNLEQSVTSWLVRFENDDVVDAYVHGLERKSTCTSTYSTYYLADGTPSVRSKSASTI